MITFAFTVDQDIGRFQVPMNQLGWMHVLKSLQDLEQNEGDMTGGQDRLSTYSIWNTPLKNVSQITCAQKSSTNLYYSEL